MGTAEIGDRRFDDDRQGVIESPVITLEDNHYVLHVSGGEDRQRLYVALIDADTGDELARCTGQGSNLLQPVPVQGQNWAGRQVLVRIVDEAQGPWGHINFGGIYTDPLAPYRQ